MPEKTTPSVTIGGTFLLGEFGTPRIDTIGAGEITKLVYALHPTKDNLSFWASVDCHIESDELSQPHVERYSIGFVSNKDRDRINFAPSEDGRTIAGPEGLDYDMLLELYNGAKTGTKWGEIVDPNNPDKMINEIELCQGHTCIYFCDANGRPFLRKLPPSNFTQFIFAILGDPKREGKEDFKPLLQPGEIQLSDRLDIFEGFVFDWRREEQEFKMKDKDGKEQEGYDVLVPCALVSKPSGENKVNSTTSNANAKSSASSAASSSPSTSASTTEYPEALTDHIYKTLADMTGPQTLTKWASKALKSAPSELKALLIDAKSDEGYLYSEDRPWSFDKEKGTLQA